MVPRKKGRKTPTIIDGIYRYFDEHEGHVTQSLDLNQYPDAWLKNYVTHLTSVRVIYTEPKTGFKFSCTFIRQKHPSYKPKDEHDTRKMGVWYGHKRINNKLQKKYVGKNDNMTLERMHQVAKNLSQGRLPGLQPQLFDPKDKRLTRPKKELPGLKDG